MPWCTTGRPLPPSAGRGWTAAATERTFSFATLALGRLTISNGAALLPVALVSFTAERLGADGLLKWTTASELRNDHFEVESSLDGLIFQRLGQVAGAGTSSQSHAYQFIDQQLARYAAALVYYRLRQVDADGTGTYSPVRTVAVPFEAGLLVQAYPNPSAPAGEVSLSIRTDQSGPATLWLTDALGRLVGQQQLSLPGPLPCRYRMPPNWLRACTCCGCSRAASSRR